MAQPRELLPQVHAVTQMLAEAALCGEGTRAARRPPPPQQQSPDRCSCPGTRHLRRVGRRWAGTAAGKSQPGQQLGEQMVQSAGEHRHLLMQAGSQGDGAAPRQYPWALLGWGGSRASGLPTSNLPLPNTDVLGPCVRASIASASMYAPSAAVGRKMLEPCLHLSHWQKLAQQFACKLYPGKYFWKGIRLLA